MTRVGEIAASAVSGDAASAPLGTVVARNASPLVFGNERVDTPFPFAGAALLIALLAVAAWAWWHARRAAVLAGPTGGVRRWLAPIVSSVQRVDGARVLTSTRFDVGGRLHVVEWQGEQWLLAVNGATQPVVVARKPTGATADLGAAS